MTSAPSTGGLRLSSYDTNALEGVREPLGSLDPQQDCLDRVDRAAERQGFIVITAALDARLVGFAAASVQDDTIWLDPVVLAPALSTLDADEVCRRLVSAVLATHERPWASLAAHPGSPAVRVLLRDGWRPEKTPPRSSYVVLSGADAQA